MTESFVPLSPALLTRLSGSPASANAPANAPAPAFAAFTPGAPVSAHSPETCAQPAITLQRNGDIVTGIRVQCGCGQVIELNCVY